MLREACKNGKFSDADIMIAILFTQELDEVMAGTKWEKSWAKHWWHMPAIRVWAKILLRFEGLNDAASTNFMFELGEIMNQSTGRNAISVRETMSRTDKLLTPV